MKVLVTESVEGYEGAEEGVVLYQHGTLKDPRLSRKQKEAHVSDIFTSSARRRRLRPSAPGWPAAARRPGWSPGAKKRKNLTHRG